MRLGKDLIGKPIYSVTDGKLMGEVKDLYLDPQATTIVGIFLGKEGLLSRKDLLIPRESVVVFGLDAILVKGAAAQTDSNQYAPAAEWLRRSKLQGRDIDTPGGTKVGAVGDLLVDEEAAIVGFTLARVYVEGPVAEKRLVTRDAVEDVGEVDGVMTVDLTKAEGDTVPEMPAGDGQEEIPDAGVAVDEETAGPV